MVFQRFGNSNVCVPTIVLRLVILLGISQIITSDAATSTTSMSNSHERHLQTCTDDSSFNFIRNNGLIGDCDWIASSARRISRYCSRGDIKGSCQATCSFCPCVDEAGFTFNLIADPSKIRTCSWLTRNNEEIRTGRYCYNQDGSSSEVGDACVASCGFCSPGSPTAPSPTVTTPTASPTLISNPDGCIDDPNYVLILIYSGAERDCSWIAKKDVRKDRYCLTINNGFLVSEMCPLTCGTCGPSPPTSPTLPTASPVKTPVPPAPTPAPVKTPVTPAPTPAPVPPTPSAFTITLINTGTNTDFDAAFASAKARWESIIVSDLADVSGDGTDWFAGRMSSSYTGDVDDVVIGYEMAFIDGPGSVLGSAGPTYIRSSTGSPIAGTMNFDEDDFASMSSTNAEIIILHEMGHVLGVVGVLGACESSACDNNGIYTYPCPLAQLEYQKLYPTGTLRLENDGGGGTACSHWEEDDFPKTTGSSELMTGYFEANVGQPITRVTIAALDESFTDYQVDYSQADPFPILGGLNTTAVEPGKWNVLRPTESFSLEGRMDYSAVPIPKMV